MKEQITVRLEEHTIATLKDLAGNTTHTEPQLIDMAVDLLAGYFIEPQDYYPLKKEM
jgi:hypothetical protein